MAQPMQNDALGTWCEERGLRDLVVVSPHLDDGAFSTYSALAARRPATRLLATVFSDSTPDAQSDWARRSGFATNDEEFTARRLEDQAAAEAMGIPCLHLNEWVSTWSDVAALRVVTRLLDHLTGSPAEALVLLPAGAGRTLSAAERFWRRLMRRPLGPPAHHEHLMVRDSLLAPLREHGLVVGFYAELPYAWSDRMPDLLRRTASFSGQDLLSLDVMPDLARKHVAACCYTSQVEHILGLKRYYQMRVLSHAEVFFLPTARP